LFRISFTRSAVSAFFLLSLFAGWLHGGSLAAQEKTPDAQTAPAATVPVEPAKDNLKTIRTREDYTTLGLEGSDLVPLAPIPGGRESNKDFTRELYQVQWRAQDPIDLFIIRPVGVKNPPVVLYLFSFPSDTNRYLSAEYCKHLVSNGAAAVGFVSANTGDRYHRPMKEWFVSELQESLGTTVHDVQMILNLLETRHDLDMTRVGMFGQGSGGAIAILAAAADPRIKALDLIGPWGDWPNFLAEAKGIAPADKQKYLTPEFLKKVEPLEPIRFLPMLKTQSIRIHLQDDKPPTKWSASVEKAAPLNAEIHHFSSPEDLRDDSASGKLYAWIAQKLNPSAVTKTAALPIPTPTGDKTGVQQ